MGKLRFEIAESTIFEVMQVRSADADGADAHLYFARTRILYATLGDSKPAGVVVRQFACSFLE